MSLENDIKALRERLQHSDSLDVEDAKDSLTRVLDALEEARVHIDGLLALSGLADDASALNMIGAARAWKEKWK